LTEKKDCIRRKEIAIHTLLIHAVYTPRLDFIIPPLKGLPLNRDEQPIVVTKQSSKETIKADSNEPICETTEMRALATYVPDRTWSSYLLKLVQGNRKTTSSYENDKIYVL
jgi:hypothetical protein